MNADETGTDPTASAASPAESLAETETPTDTPTETPTDTPAESVGAEGSDEVTKAGTQAAADEAVPPADELEKLEVEGDIAADYLEALLDIADLDGDLDMDVEGDRASVSIVGAELTQLVGVRGEVLEALQELTRLAVYRETGERSRLMLDISGHRAHRRETLEALAAERIAQVRDSGEAVSLEPMTSFERKVVHDVVTASGLVSESEGVEPRRFVVIRPA